MVRKVLFWSSDVVVIQRTRSLALLYNKNLNKSLTARSVGVHQKMVSECVKQRPFLESDQTELSRCRMVGGGRNPIDMRLEQRLLTYVRNLRAAKQCVTYSMIQTKALALAVNLEIDDFRASIGFVQRFCRRNNLGLRKPTHQSQQNNRPNDQQCREALTYLSRLNHLALGIILHTLIHLKLVDSILIEIF